MRCSAILGGDSNWKLLDNGIDEIVAAAICLRPRGGDRWNHKWTVLLNRESIAGRLAKPSTTNAGNRTKSHPATLKSFAPPWFASLPSVGTQNAS